MSVTAFATFMFCVDTRGAKVPDFLVQDSANVKPSRFRDKSVSFSISPVE